MIRSDARIKVEGQATYGVDLDVPGMLWAELVPAPIAHGRLRRVDLAPALKEPGVVAVVGPQDLSSLISGGGDPDRPIFPSKEVQYLGEPVAGVVATSRAAARRGAARAVVEVDPLGAVLDIDSVFPAWPGSHEGGSPHVTAHVHARHGPLTSAFADADRVVADEYRTSGILQVALEPHACVGEVSGDLWRVTSSTQTPFGVREDLSALLQLPESQIVVEPTWVGGGFGGKGSAFLEPYALVLAAAARRPVKLALDYRTDFRLSRSTLPAVIRLESAVAGGRITARKVHLLLDTGASLPGRDFATGYSIGFLLGPYRLDAFEVEGYALRTNKPPFGPHRAPLAPQCVFAIDTHVEAIARDLGVDPIAFRRASAWREGDRTSFAELVRPFGLVAALDRAEEVRARWRSELPEGTGIGVAAGYWSTGTGAGGEAYVCLMAQEVVILQGEAEIGSGSIVRGLPAIAERVLGVPASAVRVESRPTNEAPFDTGVFGSRTLGALGQAVEDACRQLLATLAERSGLPPPLTLELRDGRLHVRSGERAVPLESVWNSSERASGGMVALGKHYGRSGSLDRSRVVEGDFYPYTDYTATVGVAAVEIDRPTGKIRVVRYAAIQDAGTVIDREMVIAQVEGGVAMGLGEALTEETMWDRDGRLLNPGLLDYRIPTLSEVPPIEVHLIEGFAGAGPFGAKGMGEPPIIPVPAAVANAVLDATGARMREMPLTPERVARALMVL